MPPDILTTLIRREQRSLCLSRGCGGCAKRGDKIKDNGFYLCRIGDIPNSSGYCRNWEEDLKCKT